MANYKLLSCPFCGGDSIRILPIEGGYSVECMTCSATKRAITSYREQAILEWNKRTFAN